MSSNKSVVLIHGHGPKPPANALSQLWRDGIRAGLQRDRAELLDSFDQLDVVMSYYADAYPLERAAPFDAGLDQTDREQVLQTLARLDKPRRFRRNYYEALPGKSAVSEFLADVGAPLARSVGLGKAALRRRLPESACYWQADTAYQQQVQQALLSVLGPRLQDGQSVLLVSHGFGSVIAYDSLWQLSHGSTAVEGERLHTWLTLGSPLADDTVRAQLLGRDQASETQYPDNLLHWHNVAAEDDAICHDETAANDFSPLLTQRRLSTLEDHLIYNLSVRYGRSDPHHSLGYLIHPKVTGLIARWLES